MAENSGIEWTHHTFNPWIGCTKVSAACDFCYAERFDKRFGGQRWGPKAERTRTAKSNWSKPITWDRKAAARSVRERVFCASLADVFDNHRSIDQSWREDLWALIRKCPSLDWLLLTKRPQNISRYLPDDWGDGYRNVWLGTTVENQSEFDRRAGRLLETSAVVHFLSCEPLLGEIDLQGAPLDWVISGGESGPNFRHADPRWFRSLRDQCAAERIPFLFKQWEGRTTAEIKAKGRSLDGVTHDEYPQPLWATA